MKRRNFLTGIAAVMCAPFALLKANASGLPYVGEPYPQRGAKSGMARLMHVDIRRQLDGKGNEEWLVWEAHDDGSVYEYTVSEVNWQWYHHNIEKRVKPPDPKRSTRRRAK